MKSNFLILAIVWVTSLINAMESNEITKTFPITIGNTPGWNLTVKGYPVQVKLFEAWCKLDGNPKDLEAALIESESEGCGFNATIKALFKWNDEPEIKDENFGRITLAGFLDIDAPAARKEEVYKFKKFELLRERAVIEGIDALISAPICKKLIERTRLEMEQSTVIEKAVEQKKEYSKLLTPSLFLDETVKKQEEQMEEIEPLKITAKWTFPENIDKPGSIGEVRGSPEMVTLAMACLKREGKAADFVRLVNKVKKKSGGIPEFQVKIAQYNEERMIPSDCSWIDISLKNWFLMWFSGIVLIRVFGEGPSKKNFLEKLPSEFITPYQEHILAVLLSSK